MPIALKLFQACISQTLFELLFGGQFIRLHRNGKLVAVTVSVSLVIVFGAIAPLLKDNLWPSPAGNYLNEFSEAGEQAKKVGTWQFSPQSGGAFEVDLYSYCNTSTCVDVAFDTTDGRPLSNQQTLSFFEDLEVSKALLTLSATVYQSPFKQSVVCGLATDPLHMVLGAGVGVAGAVSSSGYVGEDARAGSVAANVAKVGVAVDEFDLLTLPLTVACYGSGLFEGPASAQLSSCQGFVRELQSQTIRETVARDLLNCTVNAVNKLDQAKTSFNVQIQQIEMSVEKFFQTPWCLTGHQDACESIEQPSSLDSINSKIPQLQMTAGLLQGAIQQAPQYAAASQSRINEKAQLARSALEPMKQYNGEMNSKMTAFEGLSNIRNWFYEPTYDLSNVSKWTAMARQAGDAANADNESYRFNSAIEQASNATSFGQNSISSIDFQLAIRQRLDFGRVLLLIMPPILVFGVIVLRKTRRGHS